MIAPDFVVKSIIKSMKERSPIRRTLTLIRVFQMWIWLSGKVFADSAES